MNDDEVARVVENEMEDYREKIDQDIRDNISEMQGRFIKDTVKEICTEMLVDWCTRTAEAANKNKE
jgi:multidrug efflux pump subunit AcrB